MPYKLTVDIWSDIMCPWCAIGATQFFKAVEQVKDEVEVEARFMPFELNPDMPPEGREQAALLAENYGKGLEEVSAMRADLLRAAEKAGFPMEWDGDSPEPAPWVWNSHDAHKLLRWALTVADPAAQVRLKMALMRAHFQQRRNVANRDVLLDIAEMEGFEPTEAGKALEDEALSIAVQLEEQRATENNIRSVPTFIVNGKYILQGAAEPDEYAKALIKLASMEAMA